MASFDRLNSALLVLAVFSLQLAAGASFHPTVLVELQLLVYDELSRLLASGGLQHQAHVLAHRLTCRGIATTPDDLVQGLIARFLERQRAGDLPFFVSYSYLNLLLFQEYSTIQRRNDSFHAFGDDAPLFVPDPLSAPGLAGDSSGGPSGDPLSGFFGSASPLELDVVLLALDSLLQCAERNSKSDWIADGAERLKITEDKVRDVLRKFASYLSEKLDLRQEDAAFLERLLLWEDRTYGWKGQLAKELKISAPALTRKLNSVRQAFALAAGLDPKSRRSRPARRRTTAEAAGDDEGGPIHPPRAAGKLALFPDELLCMLRYVLGGDSAALGLLNQVRDLGSVSEVHDLLAAEDLPAVARRVSTCWAHHTAWCKRAKRQYRQLSVAPPAWLDDELALWAPRGTRRWIPELCRLATLNRKYGDVAAELKTSPLQVIAALNHLADLVDARIFYERIQSGSPRIELQDGKLRLSPETGNGQVTPSCLRQNLKLVGRILDAADQKLAFSNLSPSCIGSRLTFVRTLISLRDFTTTGGTCSCERRFQLCLH